MSGIMNQLSPMIIKALMSQQSGNQIGGGQDQAGGMGDLPDPSSTQPQFDPMMLASLLRGNKMQMPPGVPTVGVRGYGEQVQPGMTG